MNLRQKAKHFKKLYENTLSKKPYPIVFETCAKNHYRVRKIVNEREMPYVQQAPQLIKHYKNHIENDILDELRPIISNNLRSEHDLDTGKVTYYLGMKGKYYAQSYLYI